MGYSDQRYNRLLDFWYRCFQNKEIFADMQIKVPSKEQHMPTMETGSMKVSVGSMRLVRRCLLAKPTPLGSFS